MADKNKKPSIKAPWLATESESITDVVQRLVNVVDRKYATSHKNKRISEKETIKLQQSFKHAEQARGKGMKAMTALSQAMGVLDHDNSSYMAPMKEWNRAVEKLGLDGRNLHDLGRGRILVRTPDKIESFYKILKSMNKDGSLEAFKTDRVHIIPGSLDDYLSEQRSSGYAGSINFDLEVEIGKGRTGKIEVQLMPRDYVETYDLSHHLFKMIRALEEVPKDWRSDEQNKVLKILKTSNAALFDEIAERTGFVQFRKKPYQQLDKEKLVEANTVLDMIRTEIDNLGGRKLKWRAETQNAITYTKSSLLNKYLANPSVNKNSKPENDKS